MDPLGAFSLACNVLQIVETSLRVLGKTAECYKNGAPDEVSTIIGNLHTIEGLNHELRDLVPDPSEKSRFSSAELGLLEANQECLKLSGDFIQLLNGLKITKKSVWHSIGVSMKTMWYQDKLAGLEKAISESRGNLILAFLLLMHERSSKMHSSAIRATNDVESHIMSTFARHTGSLEAELEKLTSCLNDLSLDYKERQMNEFSLVHQNQLAQISEQLAQILEQQKAPDGVAGSLEVSRDSVLAQQKLLQELRFPQMQERKEEISSAYGNTYEWLFHADPRGQNEWHSFISWARAVNNTKRIYWIHGKPGSGKSTIARFIYERLNIHDHLSPWAESKTVVKVAHFFWNPGTTLQKSWTGLLRSLLFQLLDQEPGLCEACVSPSRWRTALSCDDIATEWTESDLLHGIKAFGRLIDAKVFVLIDGLDELQGDEEQREGLIDFIFDLATYKNVKICISSRPDNMFQDAFHHCPRLKLEALTYKDIQTYVTERFARERRVQTLSRGSPRIMSDLIAFLVDTASGVFLWVRLVVHELLRAARDGATFDELVYKAHEIPGDLDSYFSRFIDSIQPEYRQEASYLFQIMSHSEDAFETLHGLRLLDLSYVGNIQGAFNSLGTTRFTTFDPDDIADLHARLDATTRRINSRCRGLIECYYLGGDVEESVGLPEMPEPGETDHEALDSLAGQTRSTVDLLRACNHHAGLIHRSLRDFLISPKVLQNLQVYSQGPLDARLFLCRARLAQIQSLNHAGDAVHGQISLGLASYVLSAIATDDLKYSDESILIAAQLEPIVESLGRTGVHRMTKPRWYLSSSLHRSRTETPDFLTVALDFDLVAYLRKALTAQAIRDKRGLSVLNCILFGRFSDYMDSELAIGNRFPNIEVLRLSLALGADPNQCRRGISVWAKFLGYLNNFIPGPLSQDSVDFDVERDHGYHYEYSQASIREPPAEVQKAHVEAIRALLEHGADPELPYLWLSSGPWPPRSKSDMIPVSTVLREMLNKYSHTRQELQECIRLADEKLMQLMQTRAKQ